MNLELENDEHIRSYLLGQLPADEQEQLEERAFSDKDYLQSVLAVERDLIDEYVRGDLSSSTLKNFKKRFLISDQRRRKIEFARALAQVAAETQESMPSHQAREKTSSSWKSLLVFWRGPKLAYGLSLAVVALIAIILGFWFLRHFRNQEPERAKTEVPAATSPAPQTPTPAKQPEQHAQNAASPTPVHSPAVVEHPAAQPVIASILLLPGTARSADTAENLVIAPATSTAQLRVVVAKGDEYQSYALELRTANGKLVRSQSGLSAHAGRSGRIVALTLPATLLARGNYELTLNGINDPKRPEPLGYYYFRVQKE